MDTDLTQIGNLLTLSDQAGSETFGPYDLHEQTGPGVQYGMICTTHRIDIYMVLQLVEWQIYNRSWSNRDPVACQPHTDWWKV